MRTLCLENIEEAVNQLERVHYELKARESILNYMMFNKLQERDNFKIFWEEYIAYLKVYDTLKNQFGQKYVMPNVDKDFNGRWEVSFDQKGVITLYD